MKDKKLLAIRVIVGVVFIFSAISKLKSPGLFEIILIDQGFTSDRLTAAYLGRTLISIELFIGIAFLQPFVLKKIVVPTTLLLLTAFSIYLLYLMIFAGEAENCGCFGEVIKMSPLESLLKNIVLIGLVSYLFMKVESQKERWLFPATLLAGCVAFIFAALPVRSLEDNVFSKYTHFEQQGRVDLTQGDKLVAIMDINCEHCQATARELSELYRGSENLPPLYFLLYGEEEGLNSVEYFFYLTSASYPYHLISEDEFFDLIGSSPPRIYWLKNGKVKTQWDENFAENVTEAFKVSE